MHVKVTVRKRMCVHINFICDNMNFQNVSVALTSFEIGTWFFDATHRLDVVDICAKLYFKILQFMTKLQSGHE
jgi:hypothetical protein